MNSTERSTTLFTLWLIGLLFCGTYASFYCFYEADASTPELNRARALLTTAQGATNLVYMADLIYKASDAIANKQGNPAWVVQTSYTNYESIRKDMKVVADYCLQLNSKLSSAGQGILSDSWTYYSTAIEKVRDIDIETLRDRISECWGLETIASQTAVTRTVAFATFFVVSILLLKHFEWELNNYRF